MSGYSLPSGNSDITVACLMWVAGSVLFLCGLAMGDAQRFFLRAILLGTAARGKVSGGRQARPAAAPLLMLAAVAAFLVEAIILLVSPSVYDGSTLAALCLVPSGLCYTMYRLSCLAAEAVGVWEAATEGLGKGWTAETPWPRHWGPDFAAWVAYFLGFGIVWTHDVKVPEIFLLLGLCLVAVWVGRIVLLVQRAERVAERLALHLAPPVEGGRRLDAWANLRSRWAFAALNVSCVAFFLLLCVARWDPWREFLLEVLVLCYPMLWLATLGASLVRSVGYLVRAAEGPRETKS